MLFLGILFRGIWSLSSACDGSFCLYGGADVAGNVVFTIHSASAWFGFGLGTQMTDSLMYIVYPNGLNTTLSVRRASGHELPTLSSDSTPNIVALAVPAPSWAKIAVSFSRPLIESSTTISSTSKYIYAFNVYSGPIDASNPGSSFAEHTCYSQQPIQFDFTSGGYNASSPSAAINLPACGQPILQLPVGKTYADILYSHGSLMVFAWAFSAPSGILIARFFKARLGIWWFRSHVLLMSLTVICTLAGVLTIWLYKPAPHFDSPHPISGLFFTILMLSQVGLGIYSNHVFSATRPSVPWWDKAHWYLGRTIFVYAIMQIAFGFFLFGSFGSLPAGMPVGWVLGILLSIGGYFYLEKTMGQVHHVQGGFQVIDLQDRH